MTQTDLFGNCDRISFVSDDTYKCLVYNTTGQQFLSNFDKFTEAASVIHQN